MSKKELLKHYIIKNSVEGQLTVNQAVERLNTSTIRIKQLKKEV